VKALLDAITEVERGCGESGGESCLSTLFDLTPERELLWVAFLLRGGRVRPLSGRSRLTAWAAGALDFPDWLVHESIEESGDLAGTLAALLGKASGPGISISALRQKLDELRMSPAELKRKGIIETWNMLDIKQRELFNRLVLGEPICSISDRLVHQELSERLMVPEEAVALWFFRHRHADHMRTVDFQRWARSREFRSYPFPILRQVSAGDDAFEPEQWNVERIAGRERVHLIKRNGEAYLWSEAGSCLGADGAMGLPDGTVMECGYAPHVPLSAYSLIEYQGVDVRTMPFAEQRPVIERLCTFLAQDVMQPSNNIGCVPWSVAVNEWHAMKGTQAWLLLRSSGASGQVMRWDAEPYAIDCVLLSVRRDDMTVCGEMTLGVWDGDALVPCARVRPDLSLEEQVDILDTVARSTIGRFGPVRGVRPSLVFTLAFDAVDPSSRHKAGLRLQNPRIRQWKRNAPALRAGTLTDLKTLLAPLPAPPVRGGTAASSLSLNL
jgi:DNA ligase-1